MNEYINLTSENIDDVEYEVKELTEYAKKILRSTSSKSILWKSRKMRLAYSIIWLTFIRENLYRILY